MQRVNSLRDIIATVVVVKIHFCFYYKLQEYRCKTTFILRTKLYFLEHMVSPSQRTSRYTSSYVRVTHHPLALHTFCNDCSKPSHKQRYTTTHNVTHAFCNANRRFREVWDKIHRELQKNEPTPHGRSYENSNNSQEWSTSNFFSIISKHQTLSNR